MRPSVQSVHDLVAALDPWDDLEARHQRETLRWLAGTDDVFRRITPGTPDPHLVSYVVMVDPVDGCMLLVDHVSARLWLPPGGHVEPDEHPADTARREVHEELGLDAALFAGHETPVFLTVTRTVEMVPAHTDVSLWFFVPGRRGMHLRPDLTEFRSARWWTEHEILEGPAARFDPHFRRFVAKVSSPRLGRRGAHLPPALDAVDELCAVAPRVIIINGGSSSGKTSIVREMQAMLVEPWLAVSIDDFVDHLPPALQQSSDGFDVTTDGAVQLGAVFTRLEGAWMAGIAATARAGAPVIVDDVFLSAAASQARWRTALTDVAVAWVGVQCDPDVASQREVLRPDRDPGMAAEQAGQVHHDVVYDVQVDTSRTSSQDCARSIITGLHLPCSSAVSSLGRQAAQERAGRSVVPEGEPRAAQTRPGRCRGKRGGAR